MNPLFLVGVALLYTTGAQSYIVAPCFIAKAHSNGLLGSYTPQCTGSGFFKAVQHHGSTGASWCVHPETGKQIGEKTGPTESVTCGKCLIQLEKFLSGGHVIGHLIGGRYKPTCDENGNFNAVQSSASTGYLWCADPVTGDEVQGTKVRGEQPNCNGMNGIPTPAGPCAAVENSPIGAFVPQCTESGFFQVIQRHPSSGFQWCVNPETGAKATNVADSRDEPTCGKCFYALSDYLSNPLIGRTKPTCEQDGRFSQFQSSASSGYSWCVDPETGDKIPGSDKAPGVLGQPNCAIAVHPVPAENLVYAPCLVLKAELESKPAMPGQFIPQCDNKGFFNSIQFNGSTGHRFCVNTNTGEQIGESMAAGQDGKLMCEN